MKIDLATHQHKIRNYILERVKKYALSKNDGPGEAGNPIQLVTMGYYLEQTGYFALVFDTRPDADSDGEWTAHIEHEANMVRFPEWFSLFQAWCAGKPVELVLSDGASCRITQATHTHESLAGVIGEMLRDTMIQLRDEGALRPLPLAEGAFLVVEEFDGHWSWPSTYETRKQVRLNQDAPPEDHDAVGNESEDDRRAALIAKISKLPVDDQISFWTSELSRRAEGKPSELDKVFLDTDYPVWGNECALDELGKIGSKSVVPLLELVLRLAQYPEWNGDRPEEGLDEMPMQDIAVGAIWKVRDLKYATSTVEELLQKIIRTACETNAERQLWGILPYHAAVCLQKLFKGYPKPAWIGETNRLETPELFQSRPQVA